MNRQGDYVEEQESIIIEVDDDGDEAIVTIEMGEEHDIGFTRDRDLQASKGFAQELYQLSQLVADKQPDDIKDKVALEDSLRLDKATCLKSLMQLRSLGSGLRNDLSENLIKEFQYNGFLASDEASNPPLIFYQRGKKAPIIWDMMYEGTQTGLPDWEKFWGFRVPISHWIAALLHEEGLRRVGGMVSFNYHTKTTP